MSATISKQAQGVMLNQAFITHDAIRKNNLITKGTEVVTLEDMLRAYYPWSEQYGDSNYFKTLQKADDPLLTSTTGAVNRVYGEEVWNQLNMEANLWSLLPKKPWTHSGIRFLKAHSATGGGIAEDDDLPEADMPDFALGYSDAKIIVHPFQVSMKEILQARTGDDVLGSPKEVMRSYTASRHKSVINGYLASDSDTLSANNIETIDRMTSATALVTASLITAADEDFEQIDRSANSWADSYVDHNSGTDRDLTLEMIRDLIRGTRRHQTVANSQKIFVTGEDTFERISSLYESQNNFIQNQVSVQPSLNGVKVVAAGQAAGFTVSTLFGVPIFISKDIQVDTISRFYHLDLAFTHIDILAPTQYFEQGPSTGNPQAIGKLIDEGLFVTMAQLRCSKFKAHGQIRDLQ